MNILAVFSTAQILGGGEVSFVLSLRSLQTLGCSICALIPDTGPLAQYLEQSDIPYRVAVQKTLRHVAHLRYLIYPPTDWVTATEKFKPDLIHCNAIRPALYGQALGRMLAVPVVFHARIAERHWIDGLLLRLCDGVICTTRVVGQRFLTSKHRGKVYVLHNAVDSKTFAAPDRAPVLRRRWLGNSADYLVGVIGRLSPTKGQSWVLETAPGTLRRFPNVRFVFVGVEDPGFPGYESELRHHIARRRLEDSVVFAGFQTDMPAVYGALDLVVFPTFSEGFGRVILECGAASKPLICSNLPALEELLSPYSRDFTVEVGNTHALRERMIGLIGDAELCRTMAERLRCHVEQRFSPRTHAGDLLEIYRKVSGGYGARKP